MSNNKRIAVLIPCYNEEQTIKKVIQDFQRVLPSASIYVYDNNSKDNTAEIARECGAIVKSEPRQGKGNVIRSMFRDIEADCYVMADGDDTYPADEVLKLVDPILNDSYDMIIGDRLSSTYFTENKRKFHNAGNRLVRFLINKLFSNKIKDIMTGYRSFSRNFVKSFPVLSGGFEVETEMTIFALDKKFAIKEAQIEYRDRPAGSVSKLNTVKDGIKILFKIASLFKTYRPFRFFTVLSLVFLAAAIGLFTPVLIDFVQTGYVPKFPTFFAVIGLGISSLLLFLNGILLNSINFNHRQNFELSLNIIKAQEHMIQNTNAEIQENK